MSRVERVVHKEVVRDADHRIKEVIETVLIMEPPAPPPDPDPPLYLTAADMEYADDEDAPAEPQDPWDRYRRESPDGFPGPADEEGE